MPKSYQPPLHYPSLPTQPNQSQPSLRKRIARPTPRNLPTNPPQAPLLHRNAHPAPTVRRAEARVLGPRELGVRRRDAVSGSWARRRAGVSAGAVDPEGVARGAARAEGGGALGGGEGEEGGEG